LHRARCVLQQVTTAASPALQPLAVPGYSEVAYNHVNSCSEPHLQLHLLSLVQLCVLVCQRCCAARTRQPPEPTQNRVFQLYHRIRAAERGRRGKVRTAGCRSCHAALLAPPSFFREAATASLWIMTRAAVLSLPCGKVVAGYTFKIPIATAAWHVGRSPILKAGMRSAGPGMHALVLVCHTRV
jgi:hypothetical protein